jgi:excinuclease ABC subunit A
MSAKPFQNLSFSAEEIASFNEQIHVKGARSNNLKNIEVRIPKNQLVVVTGLSGSGKSSLIMDTLYAEGQRRYVESLSSYARQFLNRMKKPDVDFIKGISPAIAIEQKTSTSSNTRSTVGSLTEIYDYLRLLYARIGRTYSPVSGDLVTKHEVQDVVKYIMSLDTGTRVILEAPISKVYHERTVRKELEQLMKKGYNRITQGDDTYYIEEVISESHGWLDTLVGESDDVYILIDRFSVSEEETNRMRIADSVLTAFQESEGNVRVQIHKGESRDFNNRFELDGIEFLEPSPQLFNFNNPFGACPTCEGYGRVLGIDMAKVIPDESKSVYDGAIACWNGEKSKSWLRQLIHSADQFDFPIHRPVKDLTPAQIKLLWKGNRYFDGIDAYFEALSRQNYKIQNRVMLARYRGRTTCHTCEGGRLRPETINIKVQDKHIMELIFIPIDELHVWFKELQLSEYDAEVADRILYEIKSRLEIMNDIGLGYLTLDRLSSTLSGGETQRINLTRMIGSNLTNSLYILDEPSVGLHPKDTTNLVEILKRLRNLDNTVIVVEHEEEVIKNADYLIDIGPGAGVHGGEVVFEGPYKSLLKKKTDSLTVAYLTGKMEIELPTRVRKPSNFLRIGGARHHNLKDIDVEIPLNALTVVSGVSGSGKTTLIKHILYPSLKMKIGDPIPVTPGKFTSLDGDFSLIKEVDYVSQSPIGRSSRSNPVTYVKAFDAIRKLFTSQQLSKIRGYKPKHFSFNVEGGRCENCKGDGEITVEMQFLADVKLVCEDCKGKRFKDEILEVRYNEKNIFEVLEMSIEDSLTFFADNPDILQKIEPLNNVGLGYVQLGQASSTLSGGEAQRVKLAYYLGRETKNDHVFFIFDEPTTGLHFHDIQKLLDSFNALIEKGHTVVVVEHNLEVIKSADWLIDLGPTGGVQGGNLMYQGVPKGILKAKKSVTADYLKDKF